MTVKRKHTDRTKARSSLIIIALLAIISYPLSLLAQEQKSSGCSLSDLNISVEIPKGFKLQPTECPKVTYTRNLSRNHAMGFFITETPYPYNSSDKKSPAETVKDFALIVQVSYDKAYKGLHYNSERIHEPADFPPSLIDHGGACTGLVTRTPVFSQGRDGVEWRRGVMCLVELPPKGSDKWHMIQAFFFDMNMAHANYKPTKDFEQEARKLFRSIRIRDEK